MNGWKKIAFSKSEIASGKQVNLVHELSDLVMKEFIANKQYDESVGVFADAEWSEELNTYLAPSDSFSINAIAAKYNAIPCDKPTTKVALLVGYWKPLKES